MQSVWQSFCASCNVVATGFESLHQGLSYRTYQRVWGDDGTSYVLMCVPTDKPLEDGQSAVEGVIHPFLEMTSYLKGIGLRVPNVLGVDGTQGLVLLEDLGEKTFYDAFHETGADMAWYKPTVTVLSLLAQAKPLETVPHYDEGLATIRGDFFLDDYLPAVRGGMPSSTHEYAHLREILSDLYQHLKKMPWTMSLWDFHSPNLMISGTEPSVQTVGVLDYQDAKLVPLGYDLAAMAYDARYFIKPSEREEMIAQFVDENPQFNASDIRNAVHILGALRNLGILGRFARGAFRDGRTEFLGKMPLVWGYLDEAFAECALLTPLQDYLNHVLPEERMISIG